MNTRRWAILPLLLAATWAPGCTAMPGGGREPTGEGAEGISGGKAVNDPQNVISSQFPLSTVVLFGGETPISRCTGVILSRTLIMTAAHCLPKTTTFVNFYGPSSPDPINNAASRVVTVTMPTGVTGQDPYPDGVTDANGNLVDLAIMTIAPPIPASIAIAPINLAPANSYDDIFTDSTWAVGAGRHNGGENGPNELDWIPITPASQNDNDGSFRTKEQHLNDGDSGGPAFQMAKDGSLILLGIASGTTGGFAPVDRYTSVSFASTWSWIQSQVFPPGP